MNVANGYDTNTVLAKTGISMRQLHHWDKLGVVSSSIQQARGSGSRRRYSADDIFLLLVAQTLRNGQWSLDTVQRVVSAIRTSGLDLNCPANTLLAVSERTVHQIGIDRRQIAEALKASPLVTVLNVGELARRTRELLDPTAVADTEVIAVGEPAAQIAVVPVASGWEAKPAVDDLPAASPTHARRAPVRNRASAWGDTW